MSKVKNELDNKVKKKAKSDKQSKPNAKDAKFLKLQQQIIDLTKERDELDSFVNDAKDQSLRSLAELENVKRRKEQEKQDAIKFANEKLFLELLPVLDSFEMAVQQVKSSDNKELKAILNGVEMIQKQLDQFIDKFNVVRINAMDQLFDPNLHQGISKECHPDKDDNTIVKEMQPGYTLNNRVLRPSMVVVSTKS